MLRQYVAILAVLLCAAGSGSGAEEPHVVALWPGQAPEEPGTIGEEKKFPSKPNKEHSETIEVTHGRRRAASRCRSLRVCTRACCQDDWPQLGPEFGRLPELHRCRRLGHSI